MDRFSWLEFEIVAQAGITMLDKPPLIRYYIAVAGHFKDSTVDSLERGVPFQDRELA